MIDPLLANLVFQPLKFSRNRLEVMIDPADTTLTDRSNLRYALTLLVPVFPQSTELTELTTLVGRERPPQTLAGAVRFDGAQFRIDEVLDGFLETQKPAFGQSAMGVVPSLTMPYSRRETVTGGTPAVSTSVTRPKEWVFKGGLSNDDFAGWDGRFFDHYLRDTRQFLTWQPAVKMVSAAAMAEEYLYFLLNFTPVPIQIRLRGDVYWADGTVEEKTFMLLDRPGLYSVLSCPVSLAVLGLTDQPVQSYRLWLTDERHQRLSEVRTYLVDYRNRPERFLLFSNSLGGFDTLRLLGQGEEMTAVTRTTVETDSFGASAIDFSAMRVVNIEGENSLTVSTGYFERNAGDWSRYLNELLYAQDIYLITEKGHIALVLTTTQLIAHEDNADIIAHTLTFKKARTEQGYSQMPATPPTPSRPTAWRGVNFRPVLDGFGKRTGLGIHRRLRKYYTDDGSDVKPILEKGNMPGDADYIKPSPAPDFILGTTPYPNAAINRAGSFLRSDCGAGQAGGAATISIPSGKYGAEVAGDADALAEAEFRSVDTQAYADANGTCTAINEFYTWNVPAGHWHYRANEPTLLEVYHKYNAPADMGNAQALQDQNGPYIFRPGTNNLDFPINDTWWYYTVYGPVGARVRITVFQNGRSVLVRESTMNAGGYEVGGLLNDIGVTISVQSGDKFYVKYELI